MTGEAMLAIDGWTNDQVEKCFGAPTEAHGFVSTVCDYLFAPKCDYHVTYGSRIEVYFRNFRVVYAEQVREPVRPQSLM